MTQCNLSAPLPAAEAYRMWAPDYDRTLNPLLSLEERILAPHLLSVAETKDIVDLGSGTGRWLRQLETSSAHSLTGVDFSKEMLHEAASKLSRTCLVHADCFHTSLESGCADLILVSFLLSYLNDLAGFAAEVFRISRPGGSIVVTDVHPRAGAYGWKRTFRNLDGIFGIETYPYQLPSLHIEMAKQGFTLSRLQEPSFGEAERCIFVRAGRPDLYDAVEGLPVLFIAEYRRMRS